MVGVACFLEAPHVWAPPLQSTDKNIAHPDSGGGTPQPILGNSVVLDYLAHAAQVGCLGVTLGASLVVLKPSWNYLGSKLGDIGAIVGRLGISSGSS